MALSEGDLLDINADAILLSHIHLHQVLGDGRIVYAGAPRPTRFGEESAKGYCLVGVERDRPPIIEHRRAPYRQLVTLRGEWSDANPDVLCFPNATTAARGSAFRLVYDTPQDKRGQADVIARAIRDDLLASGAHSVRLDPRVTAIHRVRSETIREARTTADRVRALWAARGEEPSRAVQILEKLSGMEAA